MAAGHEAIGHDAVFAPTASDEEWMAYAGLEQLIVITKDKMIRKRPNELAVLRAASLQVIVLSSGGTRMADYAARLVAALPSIEALLSRHTPPTMIRFTSGGEASIIPHTPMKLTRRSQSNTTNS